MRRGVRGGVSRESVLRCRFRPELSCRQNSLLLKSTRLCSGAEITRIVGERQIFLAEWDWIVRLRRYHGGACVTRFMGLVAAAQAEACATERRRTRARGSRALAVVLRRYVGTG